MKPPINQKRFLIIWILFHSFALFISINDIRLEIPSSDANTTIYLFKSGYSDEHKTDFWPFTKFYSISPTWKDFDYPSITTEEPNKPFDIAEKEYFKRPSQLSKEEYLDSISKVIPSSSIGSNTLKTKIGEEITYGGIFNSYNLPEYIFYITIGLGLVFIPMIWNKK